MEDVSAGSEVAAFYEGQTVLVTGGSGFMGKVLVEKLLYACPGLARLYLLMRPKRGKSAEQRLQDMWKLPMFHRVLAQRREALAKVRLVEGDVLSEDLGLEPAAADQLRAEVSVVFHGAATLRLEARLEDAVRMNVEGTQRVLRLCRGMKNLKAFVHSSTAFCHCDQEELEERLYPCPVDPEDIVRLVKWLDPDTLHAITPRIISPHPNTYTFTKRLAEELVRREFPAMPVSIARPSIVTPAWREPLPGWVDNLNGPIGLLVAAGKGVLRSLHCMHHYHAEVIPVDFAINGLAIIAAKVGRNADKLSEVPVYNLTASSVKRYTWVEVLNMGRHLIYEYPFEMTVWYPNGNIHNSKLVHTFNVFFFQWIPAYLIDFLMIIFMQKTFMVRIQRRIADGLAVLQYFTTRKWVFNSRNYVSLHAEQNPVDRKLFSIDLSQVDVPDYLKDGLLGSRQYCMKEDLSSLPRCRRNLKILYVVDKLWTLVLLLLLLYLACCFSEPARHAALGAAGYVRSAPLVGTLARRVTG
ncbi:putative fatty acyl-CoA reductase CG5065 isoform X2 [Bacillus rossius redtenbacheri]